MHKNKIKILIVEDDRDISETLRDFLELAGYEVDVAGDGFAALEILEKHGLPDLILLDMRMPKMNGWVFATEFKERYREQTPILVMSASAEAELRAEEIGASGWIEKPFRFRDLQMKIRDVTAPARSRFRSGPTKAVL